MRQKFKQLITRFLKTKPQFKCIVQPKRLSRIELWLYLSPVRLTGAERNRSNGSCSVNKGVPKNFAKFTGKLLCQSLVFNKVAGLRKFLRTPFSENTSGRLSLENQQRFDLIGSILYQSKKESFVK